MSHNSLQILSKNLELARKKLALAESVDGELAETVVADALARCSLGFRWILVENSVHMARQRRPSRTLMAAEKRVFSRIQVLIWPRP